MALFALVTQLPLDKHIKLPFLSPWENSDHDFYHINMYLMKNDK